MAELTLSSGQMRVEPNRHAPAAGLDRVGKLLRVRGYQGFSVRAGTGGAGPAGVGLPVPSADDRKLQVKRALLARHFRPEVMRHRTVLDVGGNAGFFSLWAVASGAESAVSIDVDDVYTRLCREVAAGAGVAEGVIRAETVNLREWTQPADVVLAFAMVHWLYTATTGFGSLERVAEELANRTRGLLLVEWVAPNDGAIEFFGHLEINRREGSAAYTREALVAALRERFEVVEEVGRVSGTREVLACWKTARQRELDLSWAVAPLAAYGGVEGLWSSRRVATDEYGMAVWSRVYDGGDRVAKQASVGLIRREAECLRRLGQDGWSGVPRLMSVREMGDGTGVVEMEKLAGVSCESYAEAMEEGQAVKLFAGLLRAVGRMTAAGIVHRDLRPANVLVRDGEPVVIDYGWAELSGAETGGWVPASLGEGFRPRSGGFDDGYSAGKMMAHLLERRGGGGSQAVAFLRRLAGLMCSEDVGERLGWRRALELLDQWQMKDGK